MRIFSSLLKFYLDSSIHVAMAVCALTLTSCYFLEVDITLMLVGFIFFSTITGYNFVKYAGIARLHHISLTKHLRAIQLFSLLCFIALVYFTIHQKITVLVITGVLGLFTTLYAIPFLPNHKNLRSLKSIKVFIIALVWAGTTVWLPLKNWEMLFSWGVIFHFIHIFAFVLAVMIPFEIRDLNYDHVELGTIPQLIGEKNTKKIGYFLLVVFMVLGLFLNSDASVVIPTLVITLVLGVLIYYGNKKQSKYYASFWVEAVPIYWLFLLWIGSLL